MSIRRVTIVGGAQDKAVIPLSRGKLRSSSQVLPSIRIPRKHCVLTRDLEQLTTDLETTDDKAALIQRYEDALVAKHEVCCGF